MSERQLVPSAERPAYQAVDLIETSSDTIWFNPFDYDVSVQVYVGSEGKRANTPAEEERWKALPAPLKREKQTGMRTYKIPAKSERVLPSDFDMAIQHTQCAHYDCLGAKGMYCKNPDHTEYKQIIGGLYPKLINRGTQQTPIKTPPRLHWALDDDRARAAAALEASKQKLAEAQNARDAFLIAQADLAQAKQDIAAAEQRIGSPDAKAHEKTLTEAAGETKPVATNQPPQHASGPRKDK